MVDGFSAGFLCLGRDAVKAQSYIRGVNFILHGNSGVICLVSHASSRKF